MSFDFLCKFREYVIFVNGGNGSVNDATARGRVQSKQHCIRGYIGRNGEQDEPLHHRGGVSGHFDLPDGEGGTSQFLDTKSEPPRIALDNLKQLKAAGPPTEHKRFIYRVGRSFSVLDMVSL